MGFLRIGRASNVQVRSEVSVLNLETLIGLLVEAPRSAGQQAPSSGLECNVHGGLALVLDHLHGRNVVLVTSHDDRDIVDPLQDNEVGRELHINCLLRPK